MNRIKVEKNPSQGRLSELKTDSWPTWTCKVSEFDWEYSEAEACYFFEGKVVVEAEGESVEIKKGDLAFFPQGLKCRWKVLEPVRKVYRLG